jgi:hypothetical protein
MELHEKSDGSARTIIANVEHGGVAFNVVRISNAAKELIWLIGIFSLALVILILTAFLDAARGLT